MAYYNTCPNCGSNLDPGELCDCQGNEDCNYAEDERVQSTAKLALELMDEYQRTDPPKYISIIAMVGGMLAKRGKSFNHESIQYPKEVFIASIEHLKECRESVHFKDIPRSDFDNAIALIQRTWLNAA